MEVTFTRKTDKPTLEHRTVAWGLIYTYKSDKYRDYPRFKFFILLKTPGSGFKYDVTVTELAELYKDGGAHYTVMATGYAETLWGARRVAKKLARQRIKRFG